MYQNGEGNSQEDRLGNQLDVGMLKVSKFSALEIK